MLNRLISDAWDFVALVNVDLYWRAQRDIRLSFVYCPPFIKPCLILIRRLLLLLFFWVSQPKTNAYTQLMLALIYIRICRDAKAWILQQREAIVWSDRVERLLPFDVLSSYNGLMQMLSRFYSRASSRAQENRSETSYDTGLSHAHCSRVTSRASVYSSRLLYRPKGRFIASFEMYSFFFLLILLLMRCWCFRAEAFVARELLLL